MLPNEIAPLIGLARRAGKLALGYQAVRKELRKKNVALLIFANDFSAAAKRRIVQGNENATHITTGTMQEWGDFLGRTKVGILAVTDRNFANGILKKYQINNARQ